MKNRYSFFLTLILVFNLSTAQENKTLSDQLWEKIQPCYSMFEDLDEDGQLDYDELIDDSQNGYLKISGSFPTCGCNCKNIVGAYKTKANTYLFIKKNAWDCSWRKEITFNKPVDDIFLFDFETDGFFLKHLDNKSQSATFYIDIEIPRKGTDTKVTLKTIPLGITIKSDENITYAYSQEGKNTTTSTVSTNFYKIATQMQNPETLQYLLNNQLEKISTIDKKLIEETTGNDSSSLFKDMDELVKNIQDLKHRYDLYIQIKHQSLILGWDRVKGAFYIKEKGESPKDISFKEFLTKQQYWSPTC